MVLPIASSKTYYAPYLQHKALYTLLHKILHVFTAPNFDTNHSSYQRSIESIVEELTMVCQSKNLMGHIEMVEKAEETSSDTGIHNYVHLRHYCAT